MLEFGAEGLGLGLVYEVGVLDAPLGDGVDDAVNNLLEAGLTLGGAGRAAEVPKSRRHRGDGLPL